MISNIEQDLANAEDEIRALKVTNEALTYSLKMAHALLEPCPEAQRLAALNAELLEACRLALEYGDMYTVPEEAIKAAVAKAEGGVERGYHKDGSWRSTIIAEAEGEGNGPS